jgi:hypothetical protein
MIALSNLVDSRSLPFASADLAAGRIGARELKPGLP